MSSDVQSALQLLQLNDYASLVVITAVVYDYFLTFSREIEYIWYRPWTWVSTIFVLVRYFGISWAIFNGLNGSTFVPGPVNVSAVMYLVPVWAFEIFLNAADLVMILRVYAVWHRSKWILWVLLFIFVPQVIISFVFTGIYNNPSTYLSFTVVQLVNFSFCNTSWNNVPSMLQVYVEIPRFVLGAALLVFAVIRTSKQSVDMYKATNHWYLNHYMKQLVRDGVLYFLVNVFFNVVALIENASSSTLSNTSSLVLLVLSYISMFPIMPRFIISIRELYDHDHHRSWQGIDTGFGVSSQTAVGENTGGSSITFAGVPAHHRIVEEDVHDLDGIPLEGFGDKANQV